MLCLRDYQFLFLKELSGHWQAVCSDITSNMWTSPCSAKLTFLYGKVQISPILYRRERVTNVYASYGHVSADNLGTDAQCTVFIFSRISSPRCFFFFDEKDKLLKCLPSGKILNFWALKNLWSYIPDVLYLYEINKITFTVKRGIYIYI